MTDTIYSYDTDTSQCAYCFGEAPCGYDHSEEEGEDTMPIGPSPNEVLNHLECDATSAQLAQTAEMVGAQLGYDAKVTQSELDRLYAKGLLVMLWDYTSNPPAYYIERGQS